MPNRILKQSICTSDNIDALSLEAEVFFYRLLVQCDDYGRMDARPAVLRAACFPLRLEKVTEKRITAMLAELVSAGLAQTYTVGGKPYLQLVTWSQHQQVRAQKSKYPGTDTADIACEQLISDDINGNQPQANVPVIQSNPIQSDGADAPATRVTKPRTRQPDPLFDAVVQVCRKDLTIDGESKTVGKVVAALRRAVPPYTADEVYAWGKTQAWKSDAPTVWQLKSGIGSIRNGKTAVHPGEPPADAMTPDEALAKYSPRL